jgi:hypothetical protein
VARAWPGRIGSGPDGAIQARDPAEQRAGTWRCRMVTAVRLNRAQAALLANSITAAMITLAVSPSTA